MSRICQSVWERPGEQPKGTRTHAAAPVVRAKTAAASPLAGAALPALPTSPST